MTSGLSIFNYRMYLQHILLLNGHQSIYFHLAAIDFPSFHFV